MELKAIIIGLSFYVSRCLIKLKYGSFQVHLDKIDLISVNHLKQLNFQKTPVPIGRLYLICDLVVSAAGSR